MSTRHNQRTQQSVCTFLQPWYQSEANFPSQCTLTQSERLRGLPLYELSSLTQKPPRATLQNRKKADSKTRCVEYELTYTMVRYHTSRGKNHPAYLSYNQLRTY